MARGVRDLGMLAAAITAGPDGRPDNSGRYLTAGMHDALRRELEIVYSTPFGEGRGGRGTIEGKDFERVLAHVMDGEVVGGNTALPDVVVPGHPRPNISAKTESARDKYAAPEDLLGVSEDFIMARPDVPKKLVADGTTIQKATPEQIGRAALALFDQTVTDNAWHRAAFMLRVEKPDATACVYWEEDPVEPWSERDIIWEETAKSEPGKRNIAGFARNTDGSRGEQLVRWTQSGNQLYLYTTVPEDAEILRIEREPMTREELASLTQSHIIQARDERLYGTGAARAFAQRMLAGERITDEEELERLMRVAERHERERASALLRDRVNALSLGRTSWLTGEPVRTPEPAAPMRCDECGSTEHSTLRHAIEAAGLTDELAARRERRRSGQRERFAA